MDVWTSVHGPQDDVSLLVGPTFINVVFQSEITVTIFFRMVSCFRVSLLGVTENGESFHLEHVLWMGQGRVGGRTE